MGVTYLTTVEVYCKCGKPFNIRVEGYKGTGAVDYHEPGVTTRMCHKCGRSIRVEVYSNASAAAFLLMPDTSKVRIKSTIIAQSRLHA